MSTTKATIDRLEREMARVFGSGAEVVEDHGDGTATVAVVGWPDPVRYYIVEAIMTLSDCAPSAGLSVHGDADVCRMLERAGAVVREVQSMSRKIVRTPVTAGALDRAQGGHTPGGDPTPVWVECPVDYDPAKITAEDIVCDERIRVIDEPEEQWRAAMLEIVSEACRWRPGGPEDYDTVRHRLAGELGAGVHAIVERLRKLHDRMQESAGGGKTPKSRASIRRELAALIRVVERSVNGGAE